MHRLWSGPVHIEPLKAHLLWPPSARQIQPSTDFKIAPQTGEQVFKPWASQGHYRLKPQEDHIQSTPFWLGLPVILTLGRLRQEDCELETSIGFMARYCLKWRSPKHLLLLIYLPTVLTCGMNVYASLPPPSASTTTNTLFSSFFLLYQTTWFCFKRCLLPLSSLLPTLKHTFLFMWKKSDFMFLMLEP